MIGGSANAASEIQAMPSANRPESASARPSSLGRPSAGSMPGANASAAHSAAAAQFNQNVAGWYAVSLLGPLGEQQEGGIDAGIPQRQCIPIYSYGLFHQGDNAVFRYIHNLVQVDTVVSSHAFKYGDKDFQGSVACTGAESRHGTVDPCGPGFNRSH